MNLDELVRLARARLAGREPDPDERESIRREEATQKLKSKIRSKLNFDTGSVLYLKNGPWMDGPSVIIDTDVCAVEPWEFVVRPIDGGYELVAPDLHATHLPDDRKFNDRLLAAVGDALDVMKQKS